jgi:hypothetical protein
MPGKPWYRDPLETMYVRVAVDTWQQQGHTGAPPAPDDRINLAAYAAEVLPRLADEVDARRNAMRLALLTLAQQRDALAQVIAQYPSTHRPGCRDDPACVAYARVRLSLHLLDPEHQPAPVLAASEAAWLNAEHPEGRVWR